MAREPLPGQNTDVGSPGVLRRWLRTRDVGFGAIQTRAVIVSIVEKMLGMRQAGSSEKRTG